MEERMNDLMELLGNAVEGVNLARRTEQLARKQCFVTGFAMTDDDDEIVESARKLAVRAYEAAADALIMASKAIPMIVYLHEQVNGLESDKLEFYASCVALWYDLLKAVPEYNEKIDIKSITTTVYKEGDWYYVR